jgi:hypothetical protein
MIGYEPGAHKTPRGIDDYSREMWMSAYPNIDIRHKRTLTANRWTKEEFRDKKTCLGWTMADEVPGWGITKDRMDSFLSDVVK